ncbi:MAG TPA: hypothetical protein VNQ32_13310 [Steroidobacteraceae bacterium]|nr:hypothetical protein [Steroidobacteraceae bacterium]
MIGFVLIGGEHQLLHIVPVAAELSRRAGVEVALFAATRHLADATADLMRRLDSGPYSLSLLQLPGMIEHLARNSVTGGSLKLPRLLAHARNLRRCAILVTAERTSTVLKRLPGYCPPMVHLRHGAGDRAVGFERRIALFDDLIVAGEKDRRRTIEADLLPPERCHASGYVKLSALRQLRHGAPALFGNNRPVVLYNPHFHPRLSSWRHARHVIEAIRDSGLFNLIVAPHVRLFAASDRRQRAAWECLAVPDQVLVDLGSPRSMDMTYTLAADLYLGDVSSQVYEFAAEPRPCVFLDSHAASWHGNPDYLMWEMGEVVERPEDVLPALLRAGGLHGKYRERQCRLVADAMGEIGPGSAQRAAQIILDRASTQARPAPSTPAASLTRASEGPRRSTIR